MRKILTTLFSFSGTCSRGLYWLLGVGLFTLKYALDYSVATFGFEHEWSPVFYVSLRRAPLLNPADNQALWVALAGVALPFVWIGVALTAKRLRDCNGSLLWSVFFFVPYANYLLFVIAGSIPHREPDDFAITTAVDDEHERSPLGKMIPRHPVMSLLLAFFASASLGVVSIFLSKEWGEEWGIALFFLTPLTMGFVTTFILGFHEDITRGAGCAATTLCMMANFGVLFAFAIEGLGCLIMAAPLLIPAALLGSVIAYQFLQLRYRHLRTLLIVIAVLPLATLIEGQFPREPSPHVVESVIEVDAPRDIVWRRVVEFPPIKAPREWIFRIGIAEPEKAVIIGQGPNARRQCIFNRGVFEEPIETWRSNEELTFGVDDQPEYLDTYLNVTRGQFVLRKTPDGKTIIVGRTWFDLKVYPVIYWKQWSDSIIHTIHMRVLRHIRDLAEKDARKVARGR